MPGSGGGATVRLWQHDSGTPETLETVGVKRWGLWTSDESQSVFPEDNERAGGTAILRRQNARVADHGTGLELRSSSELRLQGPADHRVSQLDTGGWRVLGVDLTAHLALGDQHLAADPIG